MLSEKLALALCWVELSTWLVGLGPSLRTYLKRQVTQNTKQNTIPPKQATVSQNHSRRLVRQGLSEGPGHAEAWRFPGSLATEVWAETKTRAVVRLC